MKKCSHAFEPAKDILELNGRSAIVNVNRCVRCGDIRASFEETKKAREKLKPSLAVKLKEFFGIQNAIVSEP